MSVIISEISWNDSVLRLRTDSARLTLARINSDEPTAGELAAASPVFSLAVSGEYAVLNVAAMSGRPISEGCYAFLDENGMPVQARAELMTDILALGRAFRYDGGAYSLNISFACASDDENCRTYPVLRAEYMRKNKSPKRRRPFAEADTLKQGVKRAAKYAVYGISNAYYHIARLFGFGCKNTVLFASQNREKASANLAAIEKRMRERGMDAQYRILHSHHDIFAAGTSGRIKCWLDFLTKAAKSDYIFLDDYTPALNGLHLARRTKLIQTWHAGFGFKRVGYSRFGLAGGPHAIYSGHRMYTYGLVGCEELKPIFEEVWGIDESRLIVSGLPRLDHFTDEDAREQANRRLFAKYPALEGRHFAVFAPTYRGVGQEDAHYDYDKIDFAALYELCGRLDMLCVFKMHPYIKEQVPIPEGMEDRLIEADIDINDLFYAAALLITDYSSCFYEFTLLKKPVLFYVYDEDYYAASRGVQRSLEELAPGRLCHSFDELVRAIEEAQEAPMPDMHFVDRCAKGGRMASDIAIDRIFYGR